MFQYLIKKRMESLKKRGNKGLERYEKQVFFTKILGKKRISEGVIANE